MDPYYHGRRYRIVTNYTATYTRYQYNVTSPAGIITDASGGFTISITVPAVADGTYNVNAIDTQGNRAPAPLTVNITIPEVLPLGFILLLSAVAIIVRLRYIGKQSRIE